MRIHRHEGALQLRNLAHDPTVEFAVARKPFDHNDVADRPDVGGRIRAGADIAIFVLGAGPALHIVKANIMAVLVFFDAVNADAGAFLTNFQHDGLAPAFDIRRRA